MATLVNLVLDLYLLFTIRADLLAGQTGFIRRVRAFSGRQFLQVLTFGWLRRPDAPLEYLAAKLGISRQALHKHFTPQTVAFCKAILSQAIRPLLQVPASSAGLLQPFQGLFIDDCTQLRLPDEAATEFPSCNRTRKGHKARMKLFLRWELQAGTLQHLSFHPGRRADNIALQQAPALPKGCLHLADLGFIDFARLQQSADAGIYWITRVPVQTRLFLTDPTSRKPRPREKESSGPAAGIPLWQQLRQWRRSKTKQTDVPARLGDKVAALGRLIALHCPAEIVKRRQLRLTKEAKRRGRPVSKRQREMCYWTVLFTNVPQEWLAAQQVREVYRLRWQIELVIKKWKSEGGVGRTQTSKQERAEVECYLKLLAQVVRSQLERQCGGPLRNVNQVEVGRVIADGLCGVEESLEKGPVALFDQLWQLCEQVQRVRNRTHSKKQATAAQRLEAKTASL